MDCNVDIVYAMVQILLLLYMIHRNCTCTYV